MDVEIKNTLEQLEEKKNLINSQNDLRSECNTLIELDKRVGDLLNDIKSLHVDVEQRYEFLDENMTRLTPHHKILKRSSEALDLLIELLKLNRICQRIDTNPNIQMSSDDGEFKLRLPPNLADVNIIDPNDFEENDKRVHHVIEQLLDQFETIYKPLETVLTERRDLPYQSYAIKVRALRASMATKGIALCTSK